MFLKIFLEPEKLTKFLTLFFVSNTHFYPFLKQNAFFILLKTLRIFLKIFLEPENLTKFLTLFCVKLTLLPILAKKWFVYPF